MAADGTKIGAAAGIQGDQSLLQAVVACTELIRRKQWACTMGKCKVISRTNKRRLYLQDGGFREVELSVESRLNM